jgi:hypothetical protein
MNTLVTRKTAIAAIISLSVAYPAYAAVPNTFSAGQAASAADVNENFTDLDGRVSALETASVNPTSVAINCGADPEALKNASITKDTTYIITGACNGPIYVEVNNVHLLGTSNANDSIVLPAGVDDSAVWAGGANNLQITNLFLDLRETNAANDTAGIWARNAFVRLRDSRIEGGSSGVSPFRGATVRLDGTNSITEFRNSGLNASDQSNINTRGQTTVTTTLTDDDNVKAIRASGGSSIDIRSGITASVPTSADGRAINAESNAFVRIRKSGIVSLTGDIRSEQSSSIKIEDGTIIGNLDIRRSSMLEMYNGIVFTGDVRVDEANWMMYGGSVSGNLDIRRASSVKMEEVGITGEARFDGAQWYLENGSISGSIDARRGSALTLYGVSQVSDENNEINLDANSTLSAEGSNLDNAIRVNFNSSLVASNSNLGYVSAYANSTVKLDSYDGGTSTVRGGEIHLGSVSAISNTSSTGDFKAFPPSAAHITGTTNLNGNNLYGCGTSGYVDLNTVTGIANVNTYFTDCP